MIFVITEAYLTIFVVKNFDPVKISLIPGATQLNYSQDPQQVRSEGHLKFIFINLETYPTTLLGFFNLQADIGTTQSSETQPDGQTDVEVEKAIQFSPEFLCSKHITICLSIQRLFFRWYSLSIWKVPNPNIWLIMLFSHNLKIGITYSSIIAQLYIVGQS